MSAWVFDMAVLERELDHGRTVIVRGIADRLDRELAGDPES